MLTESEFESKYNRYIVILVNTEQVSFSSALENLYFEYKNLNGDEDKFKELLKEWEIG